jgi:molybdate transport system permease protein
MWTPLALSLRVAGLATVLSAAAGILIAAALAGRRHPLANLLDAGINLPLVLPPTVLGYYLLVALGARSPVGIWLESLGIRLVFTWQGAVIAASIVALPLIVQSAKAAIEAVEPSLQDVARTLGRSEVAIFLSVTLPLAWRGLLAGSMLAFSRALGEFGATLMVAGNIPGRTQTLSIAIYDAVQSGNAEAANWMALLLTTVAVLLLLGMRTIGQALAGGKPGG